MPSFEQVYDINETFEENATYGPFWNSQFPKIKKAKKSSVLFGEKVNSVFGVAACPLTVNSRFIRVISQLGYDIITYKSVRSVERRGNKFPHWAYVNAAKEFTSPQIETITVSKAAVENQDVTMANSFGIHSIKPEFWQIDVAQTLKILQPGQLLILSLMCTPISGQHLTDDAKTLARLAAETDMKVFELNLACPNTDGGLGLIYEDIELSIKLCQIMKKVLGKRKLLVKVGYYKNQTDLKKFLEKTVGLIDGLSSTNTYTAPVLTETATEFFPGRPSAGISGAAIRKLSQEQARNAVKFREELGLNDFTILGIGGVTQPEHIDEYLALGVDAVQTAVGAWANPLLAAEWKNKK